MAVLNFDSNMSGATSNVVLPDWVRKRDRLGHPDGNVFPEMIPPWDAGNPSKIILPQLEDWREYVAAIANRYKGRIAYYEIFNEPNLWMPARYYIEYLQVASEEIRKADPGAKIQGICSSTDRGGNLFGYIAECLKLGAGKYIDIMTVHPYCILDESNPSQMENRRTTLAALKKDGNGVNLWLGENYYLFPDWRVRDDSRLQWDWPSDVVARYYLVDMGEGLAGSTPCHYLSFFNSKGSPYQYSWRTAPVRMTPNEKFAVHSACAHFLAGAEPLHTVELQGKTLAYVFKNGGRLLSAIWNSRSRQPLQISITPPDGSTVSIYDVMGNLLKRTPQPITLPLSPKPYYMKWSDTSADAVRDALKDALIKGDRSLAIKEATIINEKLFVTLENISNKPAMDASLTLTSDNFQAPVPLKIARLEPFKESTVETGVKLRGSKEMTVVAEYQGDKYPFSPIVKDLSAKVSEEPQSFKIDKCVIGKTPDDKDLSASFKMSLRNDILHLDISVVDDVQGKPTTDPYEQDCIELFLDNAPLDVEATTMFRQIMIPRKEGKFSQKGVTGELKETGKGYEAAIDIPIGNLKFIGFDVAIDDSDDSSRKTQLVWHGDANNYQSRVGFGLLQFAPTAKARVDIGYKTDNGQYAQPRHDINDPVGSEWKKNSFTFTPDISCAMDLHLLSGYTPNLKDRSWIYYRNVKAEGATLENGDFSKLDDNGNPVGWRMKKGATLIKSDTFNCVRSPHDYHASGTLQVEAGKPVTISYEARANNPPEPVEALK